MPAERNVVITANDTAPLSNATIQTSPRHPNRTWPTPSGINLTEATLICQKAIITEAAAVFSLCKNFTMQSLNVITESCVTDLQVRSETCVVFSCDCVSVNLVGCFFYILLYYYYIFLFISFNDKGPQPLTCHNKIIVYINECHW